MKDFPRIAVTSQESPSDGSLEISCETCVMRASVACDDCVVSFFCDESGSSAVVLNLEEQRNLRMLANAGMVPTLRHRAVS
ncbi:hypothetical protein EMGBS4_02300 [Acidimicrobiaceae bacterium]|nr:hypothetical protein EMGBS4_02300 [Acidimicrobiaceae bacterium]